MSKQVENEEFDEEPESDDESSEGVEMPVKEELAWLLIDHSITDDNPSTFNSYTAFEQMIIYEFDTKFELSLVELKKEIISLAKQLVDEQDMEEDGDLDDEDLDDDDYEKIIYDDERVLNKIAQYVLRGIITDDTASDWNGRTSLEQILSCEFGDYAITNMAQLKKRVYAKGICLRGGRRLQSYEDFNSFKKV
jgi:hypothetical protein